LESKNRKHLSNFYYLHGKYLGGPSIKRLLNKNRVPEGQEVAHCLNSPGLIVLIKSENFLEDLQLWFQA